MSSAHLEKRKCNTCEYYETGDRYEGPKCHVSPPKIYGERGYSTFPSTDKNSFCSKWEPIWHENPQLKAAWEEFILVHKLITCGEDEE